MYKTDHIYTILTIKNLVNQDGEPATTHKMKTGSKPSLANLCVLFCQCFVQKATAHVDTKARNMRQQSKKIFFGYRRCNPTTSKRVPHICT